MLTRRFFYVSLGILALCSIVPAPALAEFAATELPAYLPFDPCNPGGFVGEWRGHISPLTDRLLVLNAGNGIYLYDAVSRQIVFSWTTPGGTVWQVVVDDIDGDGLEEVIVMTRSGSCALSGSFIIEWTGPATDVGSAPSPTREDFSLKQNAPNPTTSATDITFALPGSGAATLAIYDVEGRLVRRLVDGPLDAGMHRVSWDGRDGDGNGVASGTYFYRLSQAGRAETEKMIILR